MNYTLIKNNARARYRRKTPGFIQRNRDKAKGGITENPLKKLERVLIIIETMRAGKKYTAYELAETYGIHWRSAYRYMKLIEAVGIVVEQDFEGRFYIVNFPVVHGSPLLADLPTSPDNRED